MSGKSKKDRIKDLEKNNNVTFTNRLRSRYYTGE